MTLSLLNGQAELRGASSLQRVLPQNPDNAIILQVRPDPGLIAWAVEELLPESVAPLDISNGGRFDTITRKIKWGPFLDVVDTDLSYRVAASEAGEVILSGQASWDGLDVVPTTGETTFLITGDGGFTDWLIATYGSNVLGNPEADPFYDGDEDGNPLLVEYYFGLDPGLADKIRFDLQSGIGSLRLALVRRQAASNLPATIWVSFNLAEWAVFDNATPIQLSIEDELETVEYDLGDLEEPVFILIQLGN